MQKNYKELLPKWFEEQKTHDLVLSDDIDSLLACAILSEVKQWKIRYFYDFAHIYASKKLSDEYKETKSINDRVWVDVAVLNGEKAFDNHVSLVSLNDYRNEQMINPNQFSWITRENYEDKYSGSTALMLWSLYDLPLPKTEKGKMLLLSIDTAFKGHYMGRQFEQPNTHFIGDVFGFGELVDLMNRKPKKDFYNLIGRYGLNQKLKWKDGQIVNRLDIKSIGELLDIDLDIIENDVFRKWKDLDICKADIWDWFTDRDDIDKDIFTMAFPFKSKAIYSRLRQTGEEK